MIVSSSLCYEQTTAKKINQPPLDGRIVFAPLASGNTYMINEAGQITNTWTSTYLPGLSVYYLPGDSILRSILVSGGGGLGGQGGGVQKISSDGTINWEFIYANETHWAHHDITPLPNGNVLLLSREIKSYDQVLNAGRNSSYAWELYPESIVEVHPTSPTSGEIVWEWHVWNHIIQEYDPTKDNYGIISDHPELIDINYAYGFASDWLHANSLDYNERLDQILINVRNFNEIWVIDHSTTSEEAMSHSGGFYGKGGDILYRWGNPESYGRGDSTEKKLFLQHDANWVKDGYQGSGNILVFNNGIGRGYSSVDEINPPIDSLGNYIISQGEAYAPSVPIWSYTSDGFYAFHLSGAERLPNGNTLILNGEKGEFIIVNHDKQILWSYDYFIPPPVGVIFTPCFVPNNPPLFPDLDTDGSLLWNDIKPGATVIGSFTVRNIGVGLMNWIVDTSSLTWGEWNVIPSTGYNYPGSPTTVTVTVVVPSEENTEYEGYLKVQNIDNPMDYELVPVILSTSYSIENQMFFYKNHLNQNYI